MRPLPCAGPPELLPQLRTPFFHVVATPFTVVADVAGHNPLGRRELRAAGCDVVQGRTECTLYHALAESWQDAIASGGVALTLGSLLERRFWAPFRKAVVTTTGIFPLELLEFSLGAIFTTRLSGAFRLGPVLKDSLICSILGISICVSVYFPTHLGTALCRRGDSLDFGLATIEAATPSFTLR